MVRSKLVAENPQIKYEIHQAISTVTDNIRNDVHARSTNHAGAQAQSPNESCRNAEDAIRTFAEKKNFKEAVAALASKCDVPIEFVEQAMLDDKSETTLILAKAARLSWPTTKILLSLRASQRTTTISSSEMAQCLASFERLNFSTALQIIKFYKMRGASGLSRPV